MWSTNWPPVVCARIGGEYQLREGVAFKLVVEDEVSDSRTVNDYRRWTAQLEMAIAY